MLLFFQRKRLNQSTDVSKIRGTDSLESEENQLTFLYVCTVATGKLCLQFETLFTMPMRFESYDDSDRRCKTILRDVQNVFWTRLKCSNAGRLTPTFVWLKISLQPSARVTFVHSKNL